MLAEFRYVFRKLIGRLIIATMLALTCGYGMCVAKAVGLFQ